ECRAGEQGAGGRQHCADHVNSSWNWRVARAGSATRRFTTCSVPGRGDSILLAEVRRAAHRFHFFFFGSGSFFFASGSFDTKPGLAFHPLTTLPSETFHTCTEPS